MLKNMSTIALHLFGLGASNLAAPAITGEARADRPKKFRDRVPGNKLATKAREGRLGLIR